VEPVRHAAHFTEFKKDGQIRAAEPEQVWPRPWPA
jgi:hypothetical protein